MALDYQINSDEGLINLRGQQHVSLEELFSCAHQMLDDARFEAHLPQLIDLREANIKSNCEALPKALTAKEPIDPSGTIDRASSAESAAMADARSFLRRFNETVASSVAIVINSELPQPDVAALYRMSCLIERAELFDDYDQALRWLIRRAFAGTEPPPGALRPAF